MRYSDDFDRLLADSSETRSAVYSLATVQRSNSSVNLRAELFELDDAGLLSLFKKPKSFAHHFTRGVVAAALDLHLDEVLQFGREGNVHRRLLTAGILNLPSYTENVKLCHPLLVGFEGAGSDSNSARNLLARHLAQ